MQIHRGDVFWIAPDDSRGPAPMKSKRVRCPAPHGIRPGEKGLVQNVFQKAGTGGGGAFRIRKLTSRMAPSFLPDMLAPTQPRSATER